MNENIDISYKQELYRKGIHLFSLVIPLGYLLLTKEIALSLLVPITITAVVIDLLSKRRNIINQLIYGYFGRLLRPHESKKFVLNGASWVLISAGICILLFPKIIMITAFSVLIISDIFAALIGRKYGRIKIFNKTLEGTAAFIGSAFIVCMIIGYLTLAPLTYYYIAFAASIVGGIVEAGSKELGVDDNLSIPLSIGIVMWGASIIAEFLGHPTFLSIL